MHMPRRLLLVALLLTGLSLMNQPSACAQSVAGLSCDDDPDCSRIAAQASDHSLAGRFDEARRLYEAAYALRKAPLLLYNLARVMHKAGRPAEAMGYYQRYLDAGAEGSEANRRKAQQFLEQARREAGQAPSPATSSAETATERPSARPTPIYKRWWLWTTASVAVVGIAVGIGVGLAARRPDLTGSSEVRPFD